MQPVKTINLSVNLFSVFDLCIWVLGDYRNTIKFNSRSGCYNIVYCLVSSCSFTCTCTPIFGSAHHWAEGPKGDSGGPTDGRTTGFRELDSKSALPGIPDEFKHTSKLCIPSSSYQGHPAWSKYTTFPASALGTTAFNEGCQVFMSRDFNIFQCPAKYRANQSVSSKVTS